MRNVIRGVAVLLGFASLNLGGFGSRVITLDGTT
jgi:hypothetical protein